MDIDSMKIAKKKVCQIRKRKSNKSLEEDILIMLKGILEYN